MATTVGDALRLLAELLDIDRQNRGRRQAPPLLQKQRRMAIARELGIWALHRQQAEQFAGPKRRHPRANVRLKVQLLGGPRPVDLSTDSIAVGGASVAVSFTPRVSDLLRLRVVPLEEPAFEIMGEVVWFDPVRMRAGLKFHDVDENAREILERLVFSDLLRTPQP